MFNITAKWWAVELRFSKPLNQRQVQILEGITKVDGDEGHQGPLGEVAPQVASPSG